MTRQSKKREPPEGFYFSVKDWILQAKLEGNSEYYQEFNFPQDTVFFEPKGLDTEKKELFFKETKVKSPATFVSVIPNGRVWGREGAVISPDNKLIWDVSMEYFIEPSSHAIFRKKKLLPFKKTKETLAVLTFTCSQVYYHWLFDVLPRINLLKNARIEVDKFIFNYYEPLPFQEETLALLGITEEKIIKCEPRFHLKAKGLVVPSLVGFSYSMPKWSCDFLREAFLEIKNKGRIPEAKRIYISRENVRRKVLNEDQVLDLLREYGFTRIALESLSFIEQVHLFKNAEVIVSPHGSGLANVVFSTPGTKVLELFAPNYIHVVYWVLSNHVKLDYYYLVGVGEASLHDKLHYHCTDDILIDLNQLVTILKKMNL